MCEEVSMLAGYFFFSFLLSSFCLSSSITSEEVLIKDNIFTENEIWDMKSSLSHEETVWKFQPSESDTMAINRRVNNLSTKACYSWSTNLSTYTFTRSSSWKKVSDTLSSNFGIKGECSILSIEGQINIRASHTCSRRGSLNANEVNSYIAVIFLVQNWRRNAYGELIVYDKDEILKAVYPKRGRLAIFPAALEHVIKPPAIDFSERLYFMKIHILGSDNKSHSRMELKSSESTSRRDFDPYEHFPSFKLLTKLDPANEGTLDIKQYVTRNFTTSDGHYIFVLDNILPAKELDALMHTVVSSGYNDNAAGMDSTDNVQWIMAFEVDDFVQAFLWKLVSQIVTFASGKEGYYPYDIGCNNIQSTDTTTVHTDCEVDEDDFTLLIYLNQDWTENHHGETIFFDSVEGNEVIYAVRPKYGRVAIFHGAILHSARPPPLTYKDSVPVSSIERAGSREKVMLSTHKFDFQCVKPGARLSFAVKMAPSEEEARKKSDMMDIDVLHEALEVLHGEEADKLKNIIDDMQEGKMDRETQYNIIRKYETTLETLRKQLSE